MIEQYCNSDPGYKPILIRDGWQIGHLNYLPELEGKAIGRVERHRQTDEVFILFKGASILVTADETANGFQFESVRLKPGITYNIPAGVWHNIAMLPGDLVIIVEKSDTHLNDVEYSDFKPAERTAWNRALAQLKQSL